jgi:hypothetical protein
MVDRTLWTGILVIVVAMALMVLIAAWAGRA